MVFDFSKVSCSQKGVGGGQFVGGSEAERDCVSDALKLSSFVRDAEGESDWHAG